MIRIKYLYQFPVKSLGGQIKESIELLSTGFDGDRKYMLINETNKFISLRKYPELALIDSDISDEDLILSYKGQHKTAQHSRNIKNPLIKTSIWKSDVNVCEVFPTLGKWLSGIIGERIRIVELANTGRSKFLADTGQKIDLLFTDGYPVHIINEASVEHLSQLGEKDISPLRFRANIILSGLPAFEELKIDVIEGNDFKLKVVKPTKRCVVTNVNPYSGLNDINLLQQMASLEANRSQVNFGIYAYPIKTGKVFSKEDLSITFT
jgi:uncharacterized protein YcbX